MMRVHNHGGRCCGIKHIHEFPYSPATMVAALPKRMVYYGAASEMNNPGEEFYPGPRPMEKGKIRFDVLLAYIKSKKTGHLVEVVLTTQIADNWHTTLTKKGFRKVSEFYNSNTHGTQLHVYHMIIKGGKVLVDEVEETEYETPDEGEE